MKLHHLSARNFRSFAQLDLPLNVDGLIAVVGPNGAGKTSIFQAIEWALYGTRPGRGLPVRRDNSDGRCEVTVEFEIGDRSFVVRRIDRDTAYVRYADADPQTPPLVDGLAETSRCVAGLLGLTREMFRGTFYARQREVQALDPADDAKRRLQVELLLGIERLRLAHGHAASAVKTQQQLVAVLAAQAPDVDALGEDLDGIRQQVADDAPAVQVAERELERLTQRREQSKLDYQQLRDRERLMSKRRAEAERARGLVGQRQASVDGFTAQVERGQAASARLAELQPVAARAPGLNAREQELRERRTNHERGADLRRRRDEALHEVARVADQLAELVEAHKGRGGRSITAPEPSGDDGSSPGEQGAVRVAPEVSKTAALAQRVSAAERHLSELAPVARNVSSRLATAERRADELEKLIARAARSHELGRQLTELPAAEATVEQTSERWQQLSARRRQLKESVAHDTEHRDAVLAGTTQATCPTCRRAFGDGERDNIVKGFDRALTQAHEELAQLDEQLAELTRAGKSQREAVKRLQALAADRRALGELPIDTLDGMRQEGIAARAQIADLTDELRRLEARAAALEESLPQLRAERDAAEQLRRQREQLDTERRRSDDVAQMLARELAKVGVNGYDPNEHSRISADLVAAQEASQRCATLRGQVEGLELLQRRLAEEQQALAEARAAADRCDTALAEVAVKAEDVIAAEEHCEQLTQQINAANVAVLRARQQVAAHSEAVGAAQARLIEGRKHADCLRRERRELDLRREVAEALSAFREEASRRARPTLAQQTSVLLGRTTRGRYSAVQLTDSYQLEIIDRERIYPLKRFSGGERDLASLCLRLALSRTLAGQRGAETGFVLLDEVFGSQDPDRRRALLEQLRALADSEFRQVFVVSHTEDVVEHCDLTINVTRSDDGVSTATAPHR